MALSKLNDPDNALRAFTYSLKLDPTDPVTLLNLAIFQMNTGVSQSNIHTTLQQFHQYYTERVVSTTQHELDKSMLDIATKLGVPPPIAIQNNNAEFIAPPKSIFSPRKPVEEDILTSSKQDRQELPAVKTKIYEDERFKQKRKKHQPLASLDADSVQNEQSEFKF